MWSLIILTALAGSPTDGQLYRELATDEAAFSRTDTDGDGRISDLEFDAYKRTRTKKAPARRRGRLGGHDLNSDGALTPFELYPEADERIGGGASLPPLVEEGTRPVDDRD